MQSGVQGWRESEVYRRGEASFSKVPAALLLWWRDRSGLSMSWSTGSRLGQEVSALLGFGAVLQLS